MKLFRLHVISGFILLVIGIIFDFGFVRTADNFTVAMELNSTNFAWKMQVYNLIRFYLIILGLLNIAFALFIRESNVVHKLPWAIFWFLEFGIILLFAGLIWAVQVGLDVSFTSALSYGLKCIGLTSILASIALEIYQVAFNKTGAEDQQKALLL
jgi:hypothetical protein